MAKPELPILFRKHYFEGRWEVTAFFPTLAAETSSWYNMTCYAHVGQHGAASDGFYQQGKACTPEEYGPLLNELRQIYEDDSDYPCTLRPYKRMAMWMRSAREAEWRNARKAAPGWTPGQE